MYVDHIDTDGDCRVDIVGDGVGIAGKKDLVVAVVGAAAAAAAAAAVVPLPCRSC